MILYFIFHWQKDDVEEDDEGLLDQLELEEEVMDDEDSGVSDNQKTTLSDESKSLKELRQRKDELTQRHLDQQRRKQQLRVKLYVHNHPSLFN